MGWCLKIKSLKCCQWLYKTRGVGFTSATVFLFAFLYVIKQTELNFILVEFAVGTLGFIFLVGNIGNVIDFFRLNGNVLLLTAWSILLAGIIFLEPAKFLKFVAKIYLVFNMFLVDKRENYAASKSMALGFVAALILMVILNIFSIVDGQLIQNENWIKNKLGFINPNVGSFFLMSAAFGCVYSLKVKIFVPVLFAAAILLCFVKGFYSRTEIATISLIALLVMLGGNKILLAKLTRFAAMVQIVLGALLMLALLGFYDTLGAGWQDLNNYSSNRLAYAIKNIFFVQSSGQIVYIESLDSIIFELFFLMGAPVLVLYLCRSINLCNRTTPLPLLIGVIVLAFVGILEGVLNKVTCLSILFFHILYYKIDVERGSLLNRICLPQSNSPIIFARFFGLIGIACILILYSLPVVEAQIYSTYSDTAEDILTQSRSDDSCNKMQLSKVQYDSKQFLVAVANSHIAAERCAVSMRNLFFKDWLDHGGVGKYPEVFINYEFLKKDNYLRYFMALILLLAPFSYGRTQLRKS